MRLLIFPVLLGILLGCDGAKDESEMTEDNFESHPAIVKISEEFKYLISEDASLTEKVAEHFEEPDGDIEIHVSDFVDEDGNIRIHVERDQSYHHGCVREDYFRSDGSKLFILIKEWKIEGYDFGWNSYHDKSGELFWYVQYERQDGEEESAKSIGATPKQIPREDRCRDLEIPTSHPHILPDE
jgi:hypothetical protein